MPYNILAQKDGAAVITFARTAAEALKFVREKTTAGALAVTVVSNEGASIPLERLSRLAGVEAGGAFTPAPR